MRQRDAGVARSQQKGVIAERLVALRLVQIGNNGYEHPARCLPALAQMVFGQHQAERLDLPCHQVQVLGPLLRQRVDLAGHVWPMGGFKFIQRVFSHAGEASNVNHSL